MSDRAFPYVAEISKSSPARMFTSSLFSFLFVAISGYFVTRTTAEWVAGTGEGTLFNLIQLTAWLLAGFVGGFVAGYRSVGRGWISGFLVGLYTVAGLLGLVHFVLLSEGATIADLFERTSAIEQLLFAALIALNIPVCMLGGMLGDQHYREAGHLEDPQRHTLFQIPWWHWTWLLILGPATVVSDLILSGHLLVLGLILTVKRLVHFDISESLFLDLAPVIGFVATAYGVENLWDALSVRTVIPTRRRVAKAIWGSLLLLSIVNVVWKLASVMLVKAISQ